MRAPFASSAAPAAGGGGGQTTVTKVVAPTGGDYTSIEAALNAASDGWTILIQPGSTSTLSTNLTYSLNNIAIFGTNRRSCLIALNGKTLIFTGTGVTIQGVGITAASSAAYLQLSGTNPTLNDCYLQQTSAGGANMTRLTGGNGQYMRNYFDHPGGSPVITVSGGNSKFDNNYVSVNGAIANSIITIGGLGPTFNDNTVFGNGAGGTGFGNAMVVITASLGTMSGNNISGTGTNVGGIAVTGETNTISDTVVWGVGGTGTAIELRSGSDYNLVTGCIARGQAISNSGGVHNLIGADNLT